MRKAPELARHKFPDSEEPVALLRREPPFEIRFATFAVQSHPQSRPLDYI
jgi:hypothetical protein